MTEPQGSRKLSHRIKRWMYRGDRPHPIARAMNAIARRQHASGLAPHNWVTLEVPGRRSGRLTSVPLVVADHAGERYLVSMLGEGANWVHNVRAAGGRAVLRHGTAESVRLTEVAAAERAAILRRYLDLAPGARPHFTVDRRASLDEFAAVADRYPVFRVTTDG